MAVVVPRNRRRPGHRRLGRLLTRLYIREVKLRENRLLAGERMSHEVCNALQLLVQRSYLCPELRAQLEDGAIERIRNVVRRQLPAVLEIPVRKRPVSSCPARDSENAHKHVAGG